MNDTVKIYNAYILPGKWRNFAGEKNRYNQNGLSVFNIRFSEEQGRELEDCGWPVKWDEPREEGDIPQPRLQISFRFDMYPPEIYQMNSNGDMERLSEDGISNLDWADIDYANLTLHGSHWEVNGKCGIKPYLKRMCVWIDEDDIFERHEG